MDESTQTRTRLAPTRAWAEPAFAGLLLVAYLATVSRGLRLPGPYARAHWLLHFDHGFVKRGLVGELVQPLLAYKAPDEMFRIIILLSMAIFTLLGVVYVGTAYRIGVGGLRRTGPISTTACALVFVTSPFVVMSAHLLGYFDHLLALATFAAISLVCGGRWLAAGLVSGTALLVHEMYGLAGLPIVLLTAGMKLLADRTPGERLPRRLASRALALLAPVALSSGAILLSSFLQSPGAVAALQAEMAEAGILGDYWVHHGTIHLQKSFAEALRLDTGLGQLLDPSILRSTVPAAAFLGGTTSALLWRGGGARFVAPYVLAVLSPLLMHWIAWDGSRITNLVVFNAYAGLFAVHLLGADRSSGETTSRPVRALVVAAALAVVLVNVRVPVPLMGGEIDGRGLLELRSGPR